MIMRKLSLIQKSAFPLLLVSVLIGWGCKVDPNGVLTPNLKPIARLANVPPDDYVSQNPRLTLYWVGDDPDGFVVAFRYRWNFRLGETAPFQYKSWASLLNIGIDKSGTEKFALMTDASIGNLPAVYKYFATLPPEGISPDSANKIDAGDTIFVAGAHVWASNPATVRFPVHVNPNGGTFIFDSQDSLNPHTFEVEAIDNSGDTSIPATVYFQTPQVPAPRGQITSFPTDTAMVSDKLSDVFTGIPFGFQGFDPNSRTVEYSWVVDRDEWPSDSIPWSDFSQVPAARVSANNFVHPRDTIRTKHRIYLRCKNEFGSIDTTGYFLQAIIQNSQIVGYDTVWAYQDFYCVYPKWLADTTNHRILLLNVAYNNAGSTDPSYPSSDSLDAFYTNIFNSIGYAGQFDIVRATSSPRYFPSLQVFSRYRSVYMYGDVIRFDVVTTGIEIKEDRLTGYLSVGGKMVSTGWVFPFQVSGTFYAFGPHMEAPGGSPIRQRDTAFVGGNGVKGYPPVALDSIKTAPFGNALQFIFYGRSVGFGEIIYTFHEKHCEQVNQNFCISWEGRTIGVKYDGLVYKYVYFGFPLYYCEQPTVTVMLRQAFTDIGE